MTASTTCVSTDATIDINIRARRGEFRLAAAFTVPASGITCIHGPSGAGKTSLLRALAGLDSASGNIRVGNEIWLDDRQCLPAHQREIGYVFQDAALFPHLDVRGNLEYGLRRRPHRANTTDFNVVSTLLGLDALLKRRCDELSGGEQQRVALGRALLAGPRLLLMDEPLASLDMQRKREFLPFLESLHDKLELPVLYVSHAADEIARLADNVVVMESGRTTAAGPAADILTRLDLPLAQDEDAAAIVNVTPADYDARYCLTRFNFSGGELQIPGKYTGTGRRVRIMARDVSIALTKPAGSSILNVVPAEILQIADTGEALSLLQLRAGEATLLARITRKSVAALGLGVGDTVHAQIKSVALIE